MIPEMFAGIPFLDDLGEATRVAGFSKEKYKEYLADMKNERDIHFFTKEREQEARRQGREEGRAEGLEEGRAEGDSEARRSIAVAMKSAGISLDQISQVTGLDKKTIEAL